MLSTETHDYDGTLGPIWEATKKAAVAKGWRSNSLEEALLKAQRIVGARVAPLKTLGLLASDTNNFDDKNGIDAQEVFQWLMGSPALDEALLVDVLGEIVTKGSCAQGRTTRLIQLYEAMLDEGVVAPPSPSPHPPPPPSSPPPS